MVARKVLRVLVDPLVVNSAPTALEQQVAQRQMHTHASNGRVERMAIARHQPLTAWPPGHSQNRPAEAACMTGRNEEHGRWRLTEDVETDREHEIECPHGR